MAIRRFGSSAQPNPETFIVQAKALTSKEVYLYPDKREENVLSGINLDVRRGESWGIVSHEAFEAELLLEIIGSVRPYGEGRCVLVERGMMRRKRMILPHVFFISGGNTLQGNMNTLEYLMYVTSRFGGAAQERQAQILELLLATGLHSLTLVPIKYLNEAEKSVICLMTACLSQALLVIFSVVELDYDERLANGIREIGGIITGKGGALLIGARDCDMVQTACSHAGFLLNGRLTHSGTMEQLLSFLDKRTFILKSKTPKRLAASLQKERPSLDLRVFDNEVHLYDPRDTMLSEAELLAILLKTGEIVESIQMSKKTLENAFKEVVAGHDL
jgi:ABC-2 type transport system ATP-binding protein